MTQYVRSKELRALQRVAARFRRGPKNIRVLLTGQSKGALLAGARALARELRLDQHCIDLSAVANKYIGENEKNLRRLFESADRGGATLLFEEADALFGKRSEVKDSHDRYAMIEKFKGPIILTASHKKKLDPAFLKILQFIVPLPPGGTHRSSNLNGRKPKAK